MDKITRREIIMDNYEHPFNKGLVSDLDYQKSNSNSDSCIDNITIMMKLEDNIIKDVVFDGEACAICTSATSILIKNLIGKDIDTALKIIDNYNKMINEEEYDENLLNDLIVYEDLYLQPSRKNCALLPSKAVLKILDGDNHGS